MACNIQGLIDHYKGKSLAGVIQDDGRPLSHQEARIYLHNRQVKGWKVIPVNTDCEGFDYFGGGCPGHEVKEES